MDFGRKGWDMAAKPQPGPGGNIDVPYEERAGNESIVYFTRSLSAQGLARAYEQMNGNIHGKVGLKLHTGEQHGPKILPRDWVKSLREKEPELQDSHIVETNTYYEGNRYTTEQQRKTLEVNGWTFCPVDIMDGDGVAELPVGGSKWFDAIGVGNHMLSYDSLVVLTHFKGHTMGGFGDSNKNIGIGCADGRGKAQIHTNPGSSNMWDILMEELMERIGESAKGDRGLLLVGWTCHHLRERAQEHVGLLRRRPCPAGRDAECRRPCLDGHACGRPGFGRYGLRDEAGREPRPRREDDNKARAQAALLYEGARHRQ